MTMDTLHQDLLLINNVEGIFMFYILLNAAVYLYLETVTVFKMSNTSIRGKEELIRTELESMGSLQRFLSR